ncbi:MULTISPECIES: hypothetical protein [Clostridium]|uniref:MORN repeat variant n=1 Tax=Clostridium cibarium TaxID=2762247 RepID=A0ABR8PQ41_9CLOT|nr:MULTISPECIES: hypothetical protein [Clostridium]MBD7910304.1 hypothetical protein [Clostridium cibarium]
MSTIKTKYGYLNGASITGRYNSGEYECCTVKEKSKVNILGYTFIPLYEEMKERRKELPAVKFYKSGDIKTISLNEQVRINTSAGDFPVEKIVFYESGEIKRLFPLDGRLSAYWSEEDEYKLATRDRVHTDIGDFYSKFISLLFYRSGKIKSVTLWPKERIKYKIQNKFINIRIGLSFYENGQIESCEPGVPIAIKTPVGIVEAFDKNALGIHGEDNSLKLNEDGSIKSVITSTNKIEVKNKEGDKIIYSPKTIKKYVGDINTIIPVKLEFYNNSIKINNYEYKIKENSFEILSSLGKTLTLKGDL